MPGRFLSGVVRVFRRAVGLLLRPLGRRRLALTTSAAREVLRQWEQWPDAKAALRAMLIFDNELYAALGRVAVRAEGGVHPKHRLMNYHEFFTERIGSRESVLDVGCHHGELTRAIGEATSGPVVGVELSPENFSRVEEIPHPPNVRFVCADATQWEPPHPFDVVVLSNVLEHVRDRAAFLRKLVLAAKCSRALIRVPMRERDWRVPMKAECGIDSRLDATHEIEYTESELAAELAGAGLQVEEKVIRFGEILCACTPVAEEMRS